MNKNEENNKIDENDSNFEHSEIMDNKTMKKRRKAKSNKGKWITKKYDETSSATFYIPRIKIPPVKIPKLKHSTILKDTKKSKKRR